MKKQFIFSVAMMAVISYSILFSVSYADVSAVAPAVVTTNAPADAPAVTPAAPVADAASTPTPATADAVSPVAATPDSVSPAAAAVAAKVVKQQTAATPAPEPVAEGKTLVAHVVWVKGTFTATAPGGTDTRTLKTSSNVYMNDTLTTSADSQAEIVYTDNSVMAFRPDSKLYINQYNYAPKAKKSDTSKSTGKYVMDLITGGFRTITGYVAKENPDNYQVNTPVATIGVRGTEFSIVYQGDKIFMKRYKGEPCLASKKSEKKNTLCLDATKKYGEVAQGGDPVYLAKAPDVFSVDIEVVPVTFSNTGAGYCGMNGCGSGGSSSGFCIQ